MMRFRVNHSELLSDAFMDAGGEEAKLYRSDFATGMEANVRWVGPSFSALV